MKVIIFVFTLLTASLFAQSADTRAKFMAAATHPAAARSFSQAAPKGSAGSVASAYYFAAKIIQAKFDTSPARKKLLQEGIRGLESSIKANPTSYEMRIVRLAVQENLPKFIGYSTTIAEDKSFLTRYYKQQSPDIRTFAKKFIVRSKSFSAAEKNAF